MINQALAVEGVPILDTITIDEVSVLTARDRDNTYFVCCRENDNSAVYSVLRSATHYGAIYLAYSMAELILKKKLTGKELNYETVTIARKDDFDIMDTVDLPSLSYCFGKSRSSGIFAAFTFPKDKRGARPTILLSSKDFHTAYYGHCSLVRVLIGSIS